METDHNSIYGRRLLEYFLNIPYKANKEGVVASSYTCVGRLRLREDWKVSTDMQKFSRKMWDTPEETC